MFFKDSSNKLHFLSDEDIQNGGLTFIPVDCVEITDEEAEAIRLEELANQPIYVPQEVTRFQALGSLYQAGLLEQVETAIADPATDMMTKLAWNNAQTFKRNSPMVASIAGLLELSEEQLDQLFIAASAIE